VEQERSERKPEAPRVVEPPPPPPPVESAPPPAEEPVEEKKEEPETGPITDEEITNGMSALGEALQLLIVDADEGQAAAEKFRELMRRATAEQVQSIIDRFLDESTPLRRRILLAHALGQSELPQAIAALWRLLQQTPPAWLQTASTGVDHEIYAGVLQAGRTVTNAPGVHGGPIAEYVFAHILDHAKRIPEHRANFHVGGSPAEAKLSERDEEIVARLAPSLRRDGLFFVGIDVIGEWLTEVNVTSPTGVQEIDRLDGACLEARVIDRVEELAALRENA